MTCAHDALIGYAVRAAGEALPCTLQRTLHSRINCYSPLATGKMAIVKQDAITVIV